ncbi:MAG: hypothetical protein ACRDO7_08375 [Nocardioidaceae bacterium]
MSRLMRGTAAAASWMVGLSMLTAPSGGAEPPDAPPDTKATTFRIHPGALPKGPPTAHPRLVGTTIRDGGFRRHVRAVAPYHAVWMRATMAKGYLLAAQPGPDERPHLWYVPRHGRAERLRTGAFDLGRTSPSGRVAVFQDWHGPERVQIRTIPGNRTIATYVAKRRGTWIDVLDMRGRRALLGVGSRVAWLSPRSNSLRPVVRRTGWWASARDNLLLTDEPRAKGGFAMVRLDNPHHVLWRRGMGGTSPMSISPDGRYLMTPIFDLRGSIELRGVAIRRARDGELVRRFRAEELDWGVAWAGRHHRFMVAAAGRSKTSLVRCRAAGGCERIGGTVPTRPGVSPGEALGVSFRAGSSDLAHHGHGRGLPQNATLE